MAIPETQLQTWSNIGAQTSAKNIADRIKSVIENHKWPNEIEKEVYLQGSYRNNTNIYAHSDVDLVIQLNSSIRSDLTPEEKEKRGHTPASYTLENFRNDIFNMLTLKFPDKIKMGEKSIKIGLDNAIKCDLVPCIKYRKYNNNISDYGYIGGISLNGKNGNIINFPKNHYENGVSKNKATREMFKPTVRIFKNLRNYMKDDTPSYLIECLLFNVPDKIFHDNSYSNIVFNVLNFLKGKNLNECTSQNKIHSLFGSENHHFNTSQAKLFIYNSMNTWNNWDKEV